VTEEVRTVDKVTVSVDQEAVVEVAKEMLPCVVYIEVEFRPTMCGLSSSAIGSGFIYSQDGYIVTNNHLIEGSSDIRVSLADGSTYGARLIGGDSDMDLAVLKIDASELPVAELGASSELVVGELAVAIGSPEGFEHSVTSGIISALDRDIYIPPAGPDLRDLIQTDAAINPGNSGGPLCNSLGKVVGINTAIVSESGGYDGIGFAIPIDNVLPVIEELISSRYV
jgi:serine protease Do